jgi:cell division protein FtsI/penicillin-binding protein 2
MNHLGPQSWRFGVTIAVFVALFAAVGARLQRLQLEQGAQLSAMGNRQRQRTWVLPAARGNIYDRSGAPLAESVSTWTLYADPLYMVDRLSATVELSKVLNCNRDHLREQFESGRNGRILAKGLDDHQADTIKALKLAGIYLDRDFVRLYRQGDLAAHVLGFVNAEGGGGAGIEQTFQKQLAGVAGHQTIMLDEHGLPIPTDEDRRPAQPGAHVQLTIDMPLQQMVEKELMTQVQKSQPKNAAALLIEPTTGCIVAMASWPSFSPVDRKGLDEASMRNNAIAFVYEPGSTMKPLVAGATVSEHLARWDEGIYCEHGKWTFHEGKAFRTITDHSYANGGHGMLTVTQGIALSDNILMAKLGIRMGPERLWSWETLFGFGKRTGVDLPGEDGGIMLPKAHWSILGSCMSIPMGHEIAVTPLQLAMAHAAIANGGIWQPPVLVKRLYSIDEQGQQTDLPLPKQPPMRRVFAPEQALEIQDAMNHTMTEGTGKDVQLDGFSAAGKTGTAEKLIGGHYSHDRHVGSFICWAPAERGVKPELLCLVVIDDPSQGGHYGAECAAPVVQRILQQALELRGVPKKVVPGATEKPNSVASIDHPFHAATAATHHGHVVAASLNLAGSPR